MATRQHATSIAVAMLLGVTPASVPGQATAPRPEVRQVVTFLFQPGRTAEALGIYEQQLKPIYVDTPALKRFRGYREAESPEPLDLVIVSTFDGMAGMDASNEMLRRPRASGPSAFALYGTLAGMTQTHHDQFVEMLPALSDAATDGTTLTVFEYLRIAPDARTRFASLLSRSIRPFEVQRALYQWSETGRMLVSDGWDFVRIHGIRSLGDWQHYREQLRNAPMGPQLEAMITARKTLILRRDDRLSIR